MQCVPAGDKEEHTSPSTVPAELEYAIYGKDTMRTLGHSRGSTQLLVAIERVEVASRPEHFSGGAGFGPG
jgi:hypothetical protein